MNDLLVKLKIENRVAHIVLDKPPDNRMNNDFFDALKKKIDILKSNRDYGVF